MRGAFVKKWTFPQRKVHYVQYQYFFILHFTHLWVFYGPALIKKSSARS